jgi:large subunit ribosomal protein L35
MYKVKTHSGAKKRFKVTGTGKFLRAHANKSHILNKKSRKRKRDLRKEVVVKRANAFEVASLLPYSR